MRLLAWIINSLLGEKEVPKCRSGHQTGEHGLLITGLGMMGDAKICVRCGLEGYNDWGLMFTGKEEERPADSPEVWALVEAARKLPGGINYSQ